MRQGARMAVLAAGLWAALPAGAAERVESLKLVPGKTASRADILAAGDRVDYRFDGRAGEALEIDLTSTGAGCRFDLLAPDVAVPIYRGVAPASSFSGTLPQAGRFTIRVEGAGSGGCTYDLSVRPGR